MTVVEEYSTEIIRLILSMTFAGSILSCFLFALKPIIRDKLPRSFQYYMWFAVVIALILPVSEIIVIPVSDHPVMSMKMINDIIQWISDTVSEKTVTLVSAPEGASGHNIRQTAYLPGTTAILFFFWQSGMILVLGFHILCYILYARRLGKHNISADRRETELMDHLLKRKGSLHFYKNSIVEKPVLVGIFHPAVILPDKKYEDTKLRNILMHEITHMKRHDIFVKWLLIIVGAVHWFNPLVYLVRKEMNKACELACDESVIKEFDMSEMKDYGETLIAVAADSVRRIPLTISMVEDKKILKERLGAIMKYKKYPKRTVIAASVILVVAACTVVGLSTLRGIKNEYGYASDDSRAQDPTFIKQSELVEALRNYDGENIAEAYVHLNNVDDEITYAYVVIICQEKDPDPDLQSGIKSLVSEELGLDHQSIDIDYIDFETFTSSERASK